MTVLTDAQRRTLDRTVQRARSVSEAAAREAVSRLAVDRESRPGYLTAPDNDLRLALREKARLLGDETGPKPDLKLLIGDIAYEQWHRLLFARFLEVNGLLRHPGIPDVPLSMDDCAELAAEEGEPDGWSVAARYAEEILPGVFRSSDPAVRLRFSPERRTELDAIVAELDRATLIAEDALGWVYQFWQTAEKKRVNDSGRKIGGADLAPVTQLFTENYMVRFLLENSLGAWWAGRHPDSPLLAQWDYLRRLDDGMPAAGTFDEWPKTAAEVTVMDPCCGSGHFLVAAFGMLWRMRAEEEGLSEADAQDAVLRDNLFGLELDSRCTQIAAFNVVLEAWKQGGIRMLPTLQIACSGVPIKASRDEWEEPVRNQPGLLSTMGWLHTLFRASSTLGFLIDPRSDSDGALLSAAGTTRSIWSSVSDQVSSLLSSDEELSSVLGPAARDAALAARLLASHYQLIVTNPPFLGRRDQSEHLQDFLSSTFPRERYDIATAITSRAFGALRQGGTLATVQPQNWMTQDAYHDLRVETLRSRKIHVVARLGERAFSSSAAGGSFVALCIYSKAAPSDSYQYLDASQPRRPQQKSHELQTLSFESLGTTETLRGRDSRIPPTDEETALLAAHATPYQGIATGDDPRYKRFFWEFSTINPKWARLQGSVPESTPYGGRSTIVLWSDGQSSMATSRSARIVGRKAWGRRGVIVSQMRKLPATIYTGELFDINVCPIVPHREEDLEALWQFIQSPEYCSSVRRIEPSVKVTTSTLAKVPFDRERWRRIASESDPMPQPHSNDPTQWLFRGTIPNTTEPLQVAVGRLLGYRWPDQESDELDALADEDGIVALPALTGELDAETRLRKLLALAYGSGWSTHREQALIQQACGKRVGLAEWLRNEFFKRHTKLFRQRPFLWHIWDGLEGGFAAIVNYHRLDRRVLEKLTFTVLGSWIEKQRTDAADEVAGAERRLAAATELRTKLESILGGEPPYDVYVRWKTLADQPIGWEPDLDDGVRLNIRPFIAAEILRAEVTVGWEKDSGANPDGSKRLNDLHPSVAERRTARAVGGSS